MTGLTLGFDVLAGSDVASRRYEQAKPNREYFFLRPEIEWPVSVDRLVCPSVFQPTIIDQPIGWSKDELNVLGLWSNLDHMLNWTTATDYLKGLIRFPVALRIILEPSASSDPQWGAIAESRITPKEIANGWTRLGYDIADRDQTSALSGFEYTRAEMAQARIRWGALINEWGLLDDVEAASAFRDFSDARISEQSPFYLYEIFRIN